MTLDLHRFMMVRGGDGGCTGILVGEWIGIWKGG